MSPTDPTPRPLTESDDAKRAQALTNKPGTAADPTHPSSRTDSARTLNERPVDPNAVGGDSTFPPGIDADTARDPGSQTPAGGRTDNRS